MKTDKKTYVSEHQLHVGDAVLICQHQMKKKDMPYNGKLYYITNIKGNRVTAEVNGHFVTQHTSFFKKIPQQHLQRLTTTTAT